MLIGEFEIITDDKGRISIPNKFKEELIGKPLIITKGLGLPYLSVYTKEVFEDMVKTLFSSTSYTFNDGISALQRNLIAPSVEFEVDKIQRFLIPQSLRNYAGIAPKSNLVVLGLVNRLEIWQKDIYTDYNNSNKEEIKNKAQELFNFLNNKGVGLK